MKKSVLIRVNYRLLLLFILLMSVKYKSYSQANEPTDITRKFTPLSPSAANLYNAINTPVSYASGQADISLPLYEIKVNDLTIPIRISYKSTGIKVGDPAGLIGMGWSLTAEPTISRQVKGLEDNRGYLLNTQLNSSTSPANYNYLFDWSYNRHDEEPDDYYYSTLKRNGQFYFKRKSLTVPSEGYSAIALPMVPVSIKYHWSVANQNNTSFTLTEEDGTIYEYPDTNAEVTSAGATTYTSTWKAGSIKSALTGEEVRFKYNQGLDIPKEHSFSYLNNITIEDFGRLLENEGCITNPSTYYCDKPDYLRPSPVIRKNLDGYSYYSYINQLNNLYTKCENALTYTRLSQTITGLRNITEINFSSGKVAFEYWKRQDQNISGAVFPASESYMLKDIIVYAKEANGSYTTSKRIHFYQGGLYWNRETLDSIKIFDANNVAIETYKFEYNKNKQPRYPYPFADHWGYCNEFGTTSASTGVMYGEVLIPYNSCIYLQPFSGSPTTAKITIGDHVKEAVDSMARAQILEKITYPTGGYTTFDYELNAWKDKGATVQGAGMRIKTIKQYAAGDQPPIIRSFKYGNNEDGIGWGITVDTADYILYKYITYDSGPTGGSTGGDRYSMKRTYLCNSLYSYYFAGGPAVVYNRVSEYLGTPAANIGKTIYDYNYSQAFMYQMRNKPKPSEHSPLIIEERRMMYYGELLAKYDYEANGTAYNLLRKETYNYKYPPNGYPDTTNVDARKIYCRNENIPMIGFSGAPSYNYTRSLYYGFDVVTYNLGSHVKQLREKYIITYSGADSIVERTRYEYDPAKPFFVRNAYTYNSKGDSTIILKNYAYDYSTPVLDTMKKRNIISPVIEEIKYRNTGNEVFRRKNNFALWNGNKLVLEQDTRESLNGKTLELTVTYDKYDTKGNPLQYTTRDGIVTSLVWGYGHSNPVARIVGADFSKVVAKIDTSTIQVMTGTVLINELKTLRTIPGTQVTTYSYQPLIGVTCEVSPSEKETYFEYDGFGRLKLVKDQQGKILKQYDYQYQVPIQQ